MKTGLLLGLVLFTIGINAQEIVTASELENKKVNGKTLTLHKGMPFTGQSVQYAKNGKCVSWISFKNGLADGPWQEWYENENLRFDAQWKEGMGHGLWRYFHENGKVRQEEFFENDIAVGIFREYWSNGQLKKSIGWLSGKKHGPWNYYDENGNLVKTETYNEDVLVSETTP